MRFVDQVKIRVTAGRGGDGCRSFCRDKFNRKGTPDGGDGGRGADVIIRADQALFTLLDFKYKSDFIAGKGTHGSGKQKKGKDAEALIIRVPAGTIVREVKSNCILRDLNHDRAQVTVARGGKGGIGNRKGQEAKQGEAGQHRDLILNLKIIADVGLVGFPNAGKSTLISALSSAEPKIAAYPFTTKSPVLGVVRKGDFSFVVADIPGLILGSHQGKGLGDKFLRHIERTKIILHLVDISAAEGRDPIEDFRQINNELKLYSQELLSKPQLVVANKIDLLGAEDNLRTFRAKLKKKVHSVSALKKTGLKELVSEIAKELQKNSN